MSYLLEKDGRYYYNRRVPGNLRKYDPRSFIRFALNTESRKEATRLGFLMNEQTENYWRLLVGQNACYEENEYKRAITITKFALNGIGFAAPILPAPQNIVARATNNFNNNAFQSSIPLDEIFPLFEDYSKGKILHKSENQIRKWKNPRLKALQNFISRVGNKHITTVTRQDILCFRDWWIERIKNETMAINTANKQFKHLKTIFESISDNLKLNLDIKHLFSKLLLQEDGEGSRLPFTSEYIVSTLLLPSNLAGLNVEARNILYAMSETGAGISELVNLQPQEIILDGEIPHIILQPHHQQGMKTRYRKRVIPLVGFALGAFRECPQGFQQYRDRSDSLSTFISKYLRQNNLLPTEKHSAYSLRHSFQDRLLAANTPDRVQADLMGHKFGRPKYGEGASLEQKKEWLEKIKLKSN